MEHCEIPRWQKLKEDINNLDYDAFLQAYKKDQNAILLDVRTIEEYKTGSIEHAINFNYLSEKLADEIEALSKSKNYYIFCRTGRRSLRVCVLMKNTGYKVVNLDGGLLSAGKKTKESPSAEGTSK